ncbi:hypothetical protein C5167_044870 [Papaver somniferum]|uniref:putative invertase inhibitor n=1 Tax=Papaver somniferum TaxID=3469 RepID=UPI000E6FA592|nr:putative invertase inhibitor [Papaver somniferum]XP_026445430.1 putative invertase inhibitor [Papaver somniferum]RZC94277.1 hypothetical protein C5167_044870 [Papaver somniferum]
MNQSISLLSLFSSILHVFLVLNLYGGITVNGDIVKTFCKSESIVDPSLNYDFCVSSLEANPLSKTSDIFGLAVISMDLSLKNATYIHTYIEGILKDVKQEPTARMCLKDCMEFYSTAVKDLQEAVEAFNGKDYYDALRLVSDAGIDARTCKTGFTELGVDFSLLEKQDYNFYQLTNICLDIIAKISDSKV